MMKNEKTQCGARARGREQLNENHTTAATDRVVLAGWLAVPGGREAAGAIGTEYRHVNLYYCTAVQPKMSV